MDGLTGKAGGGGAGSDPPAGIEEAYARVLRACYFAGLTPSEAEDVAQDVFLWLSKDGMPSAAAALPWVGVTAQNFIRRFRRCRNVRRQRESLAAAETALHATGEDGAASVEMRLSLDRMEKRLPPVEAKLLHLVRRGCSFAEAIRAMGIPHGSLSFFRNRLIAHLGQGMRAPEKTEPEANGRPSPRPSPAGRGRGTPVRVGTSPAPAARR